MTAAVPRDPDWLRDAARAILHEVAAYLVTAWAFIRAPGRFARRWADGDQPALNPLACMLNALAVTGPWRALWAKVFHVGGDFPLWIELAKPILPAITLTFLGGAVHGLLRLFGPRRPLRTSLAMTLFTSSGPVAALSLLAVPMTEAALAGNRIAPASPILNLTLLVVFGFYLATALAAVHGVRRWRVAVALVLVFATWMALWTLALRAMPEIVRAALA